MTGEARAVQFDSRSQRLPPGFQPWPDEHGYRPSDTSWGYIDTGGGRKHIHHGDWIVYGSDGPIVFREGS